MALEGVELLRGLSPDQLARIGIIATQEHAPPEKVILESDQALESMYIILDGNVELLRDGERIDVATQNDVLGSWALLDSSPLPVTARAMDDTVLLRVSRDDFFDLLTDNMEIASSIFSTLVKRFRSLIESASAG